MSPTNNQEVVYSLEQNVIGSVLIDPSTLSVIARYLRPEDFETPSCRQVFKAFLAMDNARIAIDVVTLTAHLKREGSWGSVGGELFLTDTLAETVTSRHAEDYAKAVKKQSIERELKQVLGNAFEDVGNKTSGQVVSQVMGNLAGLNGKMRMGLGSVSQMLSALDEDLKDQDFFKTEIPSLDRLITGLKRKRVMIVGGSTGSGKSNFAISFAFTQLLANRRVLYFSTELSEAAIAQRVIANYRHKLGGTFDEARSAISLMDNLNVYSDLRGLNAILAEIRSQHKTAPVDLVVIDHLQDMDSENYKNEYELLREASMKFKDLGMNENIAIVLVSQLNRGSIGAKRSSEVYGFSGSGKIEQIAHIALIIERERDSEGRLKDDAFIVVKKVRSDGTTGAVKVQIHDPFYVFEEKYLWQK